MLCSRPHCVSPLTFTIVSCGMDKIFSVFLISVLLRCGICYLLVKTRHSSSTVYVQYLTTSTKHLLVCSGVVMNIISDVKSVFGIIS